MEELNGRMIACQILVTGLIARAANDSKDPLRFLTDFRDEILAVVRGVTYELGGTEPNKPKPAGLPAVATLPDMRMMRIAGTLDTDRVRQTDVQTVDELFSLMKKPSDNE